MTPERAAEAYRLALHALADHREAVDVAAATVTETRSQLAALAPAHPLLTMSAAELADTNGVLTLNPLSLLVEVFLAPQERSVRGASPNTALLAGSLALTRVGDRTAQPAEIIRRVLSAVPVPQLPLER